MKKALRVYKTLAGENIIAEDKVFAIAPEMYEALKTVLDSLENRVPCSICSATNTEQRILKEVLSKAKTTA